MCPACSITSNHMQCAVGIMAMLLTSIFGLFGITNGVTLVILSFDHWLPTLLFQLPASGLLPCCSDPLPPAQEGMWGLQSLAVVSPRPVCRCSCAQYASVGQAGHLSGSLCWPTLDHHTAISWIALFSLPFILSPGYSSPCSPPPTPPPASFSLSSLLSPLNILYPSFGQNFRIRSLGPTCCFPWVRNLVLAVWSPGVWSDPLESQNPESQHLCCCTGLCWAYWSVSSLHFHYWFPYSASRLY